MVNEASERSLAMLAFFIVSLSLMQPLLQRDAMGHWALWASIGTYG